MRQRVCALAAGLLRRLSRRLVSIKLKGVYIMNLLHFLGSFAGLYQCRVVMLEECIITCVTYEMPLRVHAIR